MEPRWLNTILAVAPDVTLYLANASDLAGAVQWLLDQEVDIINFSGGFPYTSGGIDGHGFINDNIVNCAVDRRGAKSAACQVHPKQGEKQKVSPANLDHRDWQFGETSLGRSVSGRGRDGFHEFGTGTGAEINEILGCSQQPFDLSILWGDPARTPQHQYEVCLADETNGDLHCSTPPATPSGARRLRGFVGEKDHSYGALIKLNDAPGTPAPTTPDTIHLLQFAQCGADQHLEYLVHRA